MKGDTKYRKAVISDGGQWVDRNGHVFQLCVPCELVEDEVSKQASVVFLGVSMCLTHLRVANNHRSNGYTEAYILRYLLG